MSGRWASAAPRETRVGEGFGTPLPKTALGRRSLGAFALLAIGMAVSVIASLALVFRMGGRWPALVLAVYSIAVSWLMHNPIYGHGPDMFFFYKDLAITGALLLAGSWPGNSRL